MTVNETIFLLLRQALFPDQADAVREPLRRVRSSQWSKVYEELKSHAVLGVVALLVSEYTEIAEMPRVQ